MGFCILVSYGVFLIRRRLEDGMTPMRKRRGPLMNHIKRSGGEEKPLGDYKTDAMKRISSSSSQALVYDRVTSHCDDFEVNASCKMHVLKVCQILLLVFFSIKTVDRNEDWKSDFHLFSSGLKVTQNNAKLFNNVGHTLEKEGKFEEALQFFRKAVDVQHDDVGAHINIGRLLSQMNRLKEAEESLNHARRVLKPKTKGLYRVPPSFLSMYTVLAGIISKDSSRMEEADKLYLEALAMRSDFVAAYVNRGELLIRLNRLQEAKEMFEKALLHDSNNPDIHYNLAVVLLKTNDFTGSLISFNRALEIEPQHTQSLMNSAILIQDMNRRDLFPEAKRRLLQLVYQRHELHRVYFNLGLIAMEEEDVTSAEKWFRHAIEEAPDFKSALFNLALLLSDQKKFDDAIPVLKSLLQHHPEHIKGLLLMGDISVNHLKDLDSAEECYRKILVLDNSNIQSQHNLCVILTQRGMMVEAEACLSRVAKMAPNEHFILQHLALVRQKIKHDKKSLNKEMK